MPETAKYLNLPYAEAIAYFRRKINMPTASWDSLWREVHARAFSVAGALTEDVIADLRTAVDKAIAEGATLAEFRKDFDQTVERTGWAYKGKRNFRTATIFNTNLSVAYHAGHWKQMTAPEVLKLRPYLRYVKSSSLERRPEHMQWYNLVLPADDPFWKTHYPLNGWGCKCGVVSVSETELAALKKQFAKTQTPVRTKAPKIEYYKWTSPRTGKTIKVPVGIDPGWDYNVGMAALDKIPEAA